MVRALVTYAVGVAGLALAPVGVGGAGAGAAGLVAKMAEPAATLAGGGAPGGGGGGAAISFDLLSASLRFPPRSNITTPDMARQYQ